VTRATDRAVSDSALTLYDSRTDGWGNYHRRQRCSLGLGFPGAPARTLIQQRWAIQYALFVGSCRSVAPRAGIFGGGGSDVAATGANSVNYITCTAVHSQSQIKKTQEKGLRHEVAAIPGSSVSPPTRADSRSADSRQRGRRCIDAGHRATKTIGPPSRGPNHGSYDPRNPQKAVPRRGSHSVRRTTPAVRKIDPRPPGEQRQWMD